MNKIINRKDKQMKTIQSRESILDMHNIEVSSKPAGEFKKTKLQAGQKIEFSYLQQQFTEVVGGFSQRGGMEVIWTRGVDTNVHESRNKEGFKLIKRFKVKKKVEKKDKGENKVEVKNLDKDQKSSSKKETSDATKKKISDSLKKSKEKKDKKLTKK